MMSGAVLLAAFGLTVISVVTSQESKILSAILKTNVSRMSEEQLELEAVDYDFTNVIMTHNDYRRAEPAANMRYSHWNRQLQVMAQKWADRCNCECGTIDNNSPWQHIAITVMKGSEGARVSIEAAIEHFMEGKYPYNIEFNQCAADASCDFYLTMVAAHSDHFACAKTTCTPAHGGEMLDNDFVVCYYAPSSNLDERPYIKGEICSQCPYDHFCHNGLCYRPDQTSIQGKKKTIA